MQTAFYCSAVLLRKVYLKSNCLTLDIFLKLLRTIKAMTLCPSWKENAGDFSTTLERVPLSTGSIYLPKPIHQLQYIHRTMFFLLIESSPLFRLEGSWGSNRPCGNPWSLWFLLSYFAATLRIELRALYVLSQPSITEFHSYPMKLCYSLHFSKLAWLLIIIAFNYSLTILAFAYQKCSEKLKHSVSHCFFFWKKKDN